MSDPTSQSNYAAIFSEHIALVWVVDFSQKIISGHATHTLRVKDASVKEVVFDTLDLSVERAEVDSKPADHHLDEPHNVMGSALHVSLPPGVVLTEDGTVEVKIYYRTTNACPALQWLGKEATQGKAFPYLFSQCQPIYARSLAPVQDTPSVKITYSARVASTLPVLMSARRVSPPSDGPPHDGKEIGKETVTYVYDQPVPIPSYLLAIASGNVRYRALPKPESKKWTTGIWAEPELIDAAYWEFSEDTARYLAAEEELVLPYRFGVYDLLVLPPSFPYGGMENACLTFLTPTLLTGDRTLVDVVVHEATHSWFGNGVTHAHATHFWLNEGWTNYIERVLQEKLHSPAHRGFSYIIGNKQLEESLKEYKDCPKYQRLVIDFEYGEDPDNAYSSVPYEKGANFILHLERTLGGLDAFLPYVRDYVKTFQGTSITTEQWKDHLYAYWAKQGKDKIEALDQIDWNGWLYGEGLQLPVELTYDESLATQAYDLAGKWDAARNLSVSELKFKEEDLRSFDSNQKVVFLSRLREYPALPTSHLVHLGKVYKFSTTGNAEIRLRWYQLVLDVPDGAGAPEVAKKYAPEAAKWVVGDDATGVVKGRMKFCRPVMRAVYKVDAELARNAFVGKKDAFHPIARRMIEKDLGLA
ncbi:Metalloprotease [Punctularia strigosozonata HHB-11173 SS5]|uniref:Metalloprotease n=1 Tax=Punctularia strigosozonata (strain HHB-11173) TaxID=741275 RepID=UPI00044177E3|nr:Metalloprotease [Punctularia strigosozonata HHB-11173 SS5]EIN13273.1 Metalloprotease [Punctularia strigosozonata HHB-11173 SS5]